MLAPTVPVSSSRIFDEVEDLEQTLSETIRNRDEKADEAGFHSGLGCSKPRIFHFRALIV